MGIYYTSIDNYEPDDLIDIFVKNMNNHNAYSTELFRSIYILWIKIYYK